MMRDELFNELLESVRQGGAILRGEAAPSRAFVADEVDVRELLPVSAEHPQAVPDALR